jgi:hypothetical protein
VDRIQSANSLRSTRIVAGQVTDPPPATQSPAPPRGPDFFSSPPGYSGLQRPEDGPRGANVLTDARIPLGRNGLSESAVPGTRVERGRIMFHAPKG